MRLTARLFISLFILGASAVPAFAQQSVQVSAGSQIGASGAALSGSVVSGSYGFTPVDRLTLLVNIERVHTPMRVRQYENGSAATRGGTTMFVSGEARFDILGGERATPYVLAGYGRGVSRPNVNDRFPDPVTNKTSLLYAGAGVSGPVGEKVTVFADTRFVFHAERDSLGFMLPLRAGVAVKF